MPRRPILSLALLLILTALVHGRTLRFDFVGYDDPQRLLDNAHVTTGLTAEGLVWAWTTSAHAPYWHPVTWLTHMVDCEVYGLRPAGHHATNVLLHLGCVAAFYALLIRSTGRRRTSLLAAALFGLHPIQAGTVAWISARPDLLATLFSLLALLAYVHRVRGARTGPFVAMAMVAAVLSKPVAAVLPMTMLLLDHWPLERGTGEWARRFREKIPWFALSAAGAATVFLDFEQVGGVAEASRVSLPFRLANAAVSYVRYLGKLLWPSELSAHYPHPNLPGGEPWSTGQIAGALILLSAVTVATLYARRQRYLATGWLWYLLALLPVAGLFQVGDQAMAGRYLYFPAIGLWIVCAWSARTALESAPPVVRSFAWRAGCLVLLALMSWGSWAQSGPWRDSRSLFRRELEIHPRDPVMNYNLGVTLEQEADAVGAERHYRLALEVRPDDARAHNNLGNLMHGRQLDQEAAQHFRRAVELDSTFAAAWNNLANSLRSLDRGKEAIAAYRRALSLRPSLSEARINLASALHSAGRVEEAATEYRLYLDSNPRDGKAHNDLAWALLRSRAADPGEALAHAERAAELTGHSDAKVLGTLSEACLRDGQRERAARIIDRALQLEDLDDAVAESLARQRERIRAHPADPG